MRSEKIDRRVKYTKMVLRQSLLELMKQSSINKITVKDICDLADINRGTFYAHYTDPYDLLNKIEKELYEDIKRAMGESIKVQTAVYDVFDCISANSDVCKIILGEHGDTEFLRNILNIAYQKFVDDWKSSITPEDEAMLEYMYSFIANGSVGVIQSWIQGGMVEGHHEIAAIVDKLTNNGIKSFLKMSEL